MRWRSPFLIGALVGVVLVVLVAVPALVMGYTDRVPPGARPGALGPLVGLLLLSGLVWLGLTAFQRVHLRPDPLYTLQDRYVRGEIKHEDYKRMRETLLDERR
jgi:uncharacterized membrane protein